MPQWTERSGLRVAPVLAEFVEARALPGTGVEPSAFWEGLSALVHEMGPRNRALLIRREQLQSQIDDWHIAQGGAPHDPDDYETFLREIGYLVPEGPDFVIETPPTDPEIACLAGPQLVVPVTNARFALNAANARWGSLYDALYGTDALDAPATRPGAYDEARGAAVIAAARRFLDEAVPLSRGSWTDLSTLDDLPLADPAQLVGHTGRGPLLRNNGLHIELVDRKSVV